MTLRSPASVIDYLAIVVVCVAVCATRSLHAAGLISAGGNLSPDYFCTWNVQGYVSNYANGDAQWRTLVQDNLFGHETYQNWIDFFPRSATRCSLCSMTPGMCRLAGIRGTSEA